MTALFQQIKSPEKTTKNIFYEKIFNFCGKSIFWLFTTTQRRALKPSNFSTLNKEKRLSAQPQISIKNNKQLLNLSNIRVENNEKGVLKGK